MARSGNSFGTASGCAHCGGKQFVLKGAASDDAPVTCLNCGAPLGTWKNIRAGMLDPIESEPAKSGVARPVIARKATAT